MPDTTPVISAKNLNLWYGDFKALKNISLDVGEREITALIGPSGCGKSTFLKTLNRMNDLVPGVRIEGDVRLKGQDIFARDMELTDLRRRVGMVFQKANPFPMSIYDNITYGPRLHGVRNKAELDELVESSLRGAALWDEVKDRLKKSDLYIREPQFAVYNEEAETAAIAQMHEKNAETKVEKVSQTDIRFTVNAKSNDILFTTIPAEKGWTVYVDGVKTDYDTALNDALMTVKLSEGEHVVEFKFFAAGLGTGLILTVIGIAVFVGMILIYLKIKKPVKLSKAVNNDEDIDKDKTDAIIESDISEESEGKE